MKSSVFGIGWGGRGYTSDMAPRNEADSSGQVMERWFERLKRCIVSQKRQENETTRSVEILKKKGWIVMAVTVVNRSRKMSIIDGMSGRAGER